MNNLFFTSDHHFYHNTVISFCGRPFIDLPEMHDYLIRAWNSTVTTDSTVVVVGDFCFGNSKQRTDILEQLNGTKILVQGNHDSGKTTPPGFTLMVNELTIYVAGIPVTVKHYPLKWSAEEFEIQKASGNWNGHTPKYIERFPVDEGQYHIHGHCLPLDYEVLTTNRGFVKLNAVTTEDTAAAYSEGHIVESRISEVINTTYTGTMFDFKAPKFTQSMTSEHRLKLKDGRYLPIKECVATGIKLKELPITPEPLIKDTSSIDISDDLLRLVIAVCADGSFGKNTSPIRFNLTKQRKIDRLTYLFNQLGEDISWSELSKTGSRKSIGLCPKFTSELKELIGVNKTLPQWMLSLSTHQRAVVINELPLWDGSIISTNSRQFCSSKTIDIDTAQALLMLQGIPSNRPRSDVVTYSINSNIGDSVTKLSRLVSGREVTELPVGCITTEHQSFVTRSPCGKVSVTGNSHSPESFVENQLHVGVDAWDFKPVSLKKITGYIQAREAQKNV